MKDKTYTKELVLAGLLLALGLVLPYIFHKIPGNPGRVFLPMHIASLIGGFVLRPSFAVILGVITPFTNSMISGMPPFFPLAIQMSFELGVYALIIAFLKKRTDLNNLLILIIAMLLGRLLAGFFNYILAMVLNIDKVSPFTWATGVLITGLPGIFIQLVLIPLIVKQIEDNYINR